MSKIKDDMLDQEKEQIEALEKEREYFEKRDVNLDRYIKVLQAYYEEQKFNAPFQEWVNGLSVAEVDEIIHS